MLWILSFARIMGKNIGKNIPKNLSINIVKNLLIMLRNYAKKMHLELLQKEQLKKQQKKLVI